MAAIAIFTNAPGSHPFQERRVVLSEPAKIGRSVAQARPGTSNSIFDCKVLSRNHALLWYDSGKFFLQDTKSSNGTFVNSQRLSKGSEESPPREIFSGDTIQFGVDVMENSRKVTHNCIIANIQLFHPNGQEAISSCVSSGDMTNHGLKSQELYQLAQCLQEAMHREQTLENKLTELRRLLQQTQETTECGWQALVDEDRLLSRLECLEDQLAVFSKGVTDDSLRRQVLDLQTDKANYETATKDSLRHFLEEKLEAVRKVYDLEQSLSGTEAECAHQEEVCHQLETELHSLAEKCELQTGELSELNEKLRETESKHSSEQNELKEENQRLQAHLDAMIAQVESLQAENDFASEQMMNMKAKLDCLKNTAETTPQKTGECVSRGVQADFVSLADLHLLNENEKSDNEDEEKADDDNCRLETSVEQFQQQPFITLISAENSSVQNAAHSASADELRKLRAKISSYKEQLSACTSQLEDTQTLVGMLQNELHNAELEKVAQAKRIASLEDELQNAELEKSCQSAKILSLEVHVKSLQEQLCHAPSSFMRDDVIATSCTEVDSVQQAFERETIRNKAEFIQLKAECAELRQRVHDIEQEMKQSRRQNEELKADYSRLQDSYRELEAIKNGLVDNENVYRDNLTDAQKEVAVIRTQLSSTQLELSKQRAKHDEQVATLQAELNDSLDDYQTLSYNSRMVSFCSSIPLAILLFVIAIAFHPVLSVLTATHSPT